MPTFKQNFNKIFIGICFFLIGVVFLIAIIGTLVLTKDLLPFCFVSPINFAVMGTIITITCSFGLVFLFAYSMVATFQIAKEYFKEERKYE